MKNVFTSKGDTCEYCYNICKFLAIYFKALKLTLKVDSYTTPFKIASKLTSIVTMLANIALAGDHIFQILGQYS